jgi:hypothetical protein
MANGCERCNGTGSYSYDMQYGSMCFSCKGTGRKLAKGEKAAAVIPAPFGSRLSVSNPYDPNSDWSVFIPKAHKSVRGVTVKFKTESDALSAYPDTVKR